MAISVIYGCRAESYRQFFVLCGMAGVLWNGRSNGGFDMKCGIAQAFHSICGTSKVICEKWLKTVGFCLKIYKHQAYWGPVIMLLRACTLLCLVPDAFFMARYCVRGTTIHSLTLVPV